MKWVGRVLLIVLIASTLFVAKQNDFQTETAFAQTGSTRNLTLNLNDIEVRVVKRDNSSSTTAGSAVIDSQTTAVYFNKVKVTNNSNQDIYFRITAQLYYGTTPGPCAIAGGISCAPPNQYRIVTPGQTLTLPDNTFLLPSSMFNFLSGQYPFQTLALQGINKADLNFILSEAGYASTNVTKAQILKWSAVRVKLQDGAGIPVSGKLVGLFKEGESNTQPPPDQWRSGNTNAAGQAAMALLDPITTLPAPPLTYTTRYQDGPNPQDYTDLPPPVVVTGADFQDLTFTICDGGTGGIGGIGTGIISRAQAQEVCLPDLVPVLTGIEVITTDKLGRITIQGSPQVKISDDIVSLTISNIKIKNVGTGPAVGEIRVAIIPVGGTTVNLNLGSGQEMTLPSLNFKNSVEIAGLWERFTDTTKSSQKVKVDFVVMVDVDQKMTEANENNNRIVLNDFFAWPAIMVSVFTSDNKPVADAVVSFLRTDLKVSPQKSVTDEDGRAFLVPTASPTNAPKYKVSVSLGAVGLSPPTPSNIVITDYALYQSSLRLNKTLLIIKPRLYEEWNDLEGKQTELARPTHGGLNIKRLSDNTLFYAPIKNGLAVFPSLENEILLPGDYGLEPSIGRLKYQVDPILLPKFEEIEYRYPEAESPKPIHIYLFSVQAEQISEEGVVFYLPRRCLSVSPIEFCWEDDRNHLQPGIDQAFAPLRTAFNRLQSWPRYKPVVDQSQKILITVNAVNPGYGGEFEDKTTDGFPIKLNNRLMLIQNDKARQMVLTHEFFHWLDIQEGNISGDDPYRLGLAVQSNMTGLKLWDITSWTCAFEPIPNCSGYSHEVISSEAEKEALAEEFASLCSGKEMFARLSDNQLLSESWIQKYSGSIPTDLFLNRDNVIKRLSGQLQDRQGQPVSVPQLEAWRDQCLNN